MRLCSARAGPFSRQAREPGGGGGWYILFSWAYFSFGHKDEPGSWAYFSFGHKYPLKGEVSRNAAVACNQCHEDNAKKDDWVFSQYYPVLRGAASKSK